MEILYANPDGSVGVVTDVTNVIDLGEFNLSKLEEWITQIKLLYPDQIKAKRDIYIQFRKSMKEEQPSYLIFASIDGEDPKVAVCGMFRDDGKEWGKE
jgi:hypothetical protein